MTTVTVSPKFQVVIPKELRKKLRLRPGQKLMMYERDGNLRLDLPRPISSLFGIAKGMIEPWDHEKDRDHSERL